MTYGHPQADCLYTGISSGPNARYRVWEAFTFLPFRWVHERQSWWNYAGGCGETDLWNGWVLSGEWKRERVMSGKSDGETEDGDPTREDSDDSEEERFKLLRVVTYDT